MPEKAITDKIDFNKSEQYILSIRLSTDGFSFSIYNPIRDSFVLTQPWSIETGISFTANMKQAFKELDFLSYTYKQVNVVFVSKRFTLVPLDLFSEDQANTCFYYNYSPKENEIVLYDTLPKNGAAILYAMDKSLNNLLQERYPQMQLRFFVTPLAEHFAVKSRLGSDKKMYVYLRQDAIDLYVYERGHLLLLNSYICEHEADRAYYLLYAWKQLDLDQQTDELWISSESVGKDEFVQEMSRFIAHISTFNPIPEFHKS